MIEAGYGSGHSYWDDCAPAPYWPQRERSVDYETAARLAKRLRPFAKKADIELQTDHQLQEVHLTRK